MGKYLRVDGTPNLVRDKVTGAILNINNSEVKQARQRKKAWKEQQEKTESLTSEIDSLKRDICEIKTLLGRILEVSNGNHHD